VNAASTWQTWAAPSAVFAALTAIFAKVGIENVSYFRALKIGEAVKVAPIDKLSVALEAIFGAMFLGEKLTCRIGWVSR
jgi:transporter family protein